METVETKVSNELCTGCGGCKNICPTNAIEMKPDSEGFMMPVVDRQRCIGCSKCVKMCPILHFHQKNKGNPDVYAAMAKDEIRAVSSSGGMFTLLAEDIINNGGAVCGAVYDESLNVYHRVVDSHDELGNMRGSKYLQSNTNTVYREVKQILKEGREVLFTGCPCQVAGLYYFLGEKYDRLYTMDLICHGVPSPMVFDKYLNETFGEKRKDICRFDFRDKSVYGWMSSMNVYFKDGTEYHRHCNDDPYYQAFLPIVSIRKSCAACKFSSIPRMADISIGDFWGIGNYDQKLNDNKGTSLVLVNSPKGKSAFEAMKVKMKHWESVPLSYAIPGNGTLAHPFQPHSARERFFRDLDLKPLKELIDKAKRHYYDIGIVGLWYGLNYGSILTSYALYQLVRSMGFDAIMVNKPQSLWNDRYIDRNSVANRFIYRYCNVSNIREGFCGWRGLNNHCDTFIVGSDVVWNYQICGKDTGQFFFLDFVEDNKKKIAMASSFGAGYDAPEIDRILSGHYLRKFDYVAVREDEGVKICEDTFGVEAEKVLDPVFLCDRQIFHRLADLSSGENGRYIVSYVLGPVPETKIILLRISQILHCPLKNIDNPNIPGQFNQITGLESLPELSVEDWLFYIKNTEFFVGDSFHGLCFSLIFEKQFLIAVDSKVASLCRFTSLLGMLGLEHRLIYVDKDNFADKEYLINEKIDYGRVRDILARQSEKSCQWLHHAINGKKKKSPDCYDVLIGKLQDKISELENEIQILKNANDVKKEGINGENTKNQLKSMDEERSRNQPEISIRGERNDFDTALYTLWFRLNYGGILTACALYKTLEQLGKKPALLQKPPMLWTEHYAEKNNIAGRFAYENCCILEIFDNVEDEKLLNEKIDIHVAGSDLIWNYDMAGRETGNYFFLENVPSSYKKISCASSFGRDVADAGERQNIYYHLLRRFNGISVADDRNVQIVKKYFDMEATELLDPVFLCEKQFYVDCAARSAANQNESVKSFLFAYIESGNKRKRSFILRGNDILLHCRGSLLRCMIDINQFPESKEALGIDPAYFIRVEDWLHYLINSEFVLTDTIYGMYFALIFEKPFAVLLNESDKDLYRFRQFLSPLGLEERIVILQGDLKTKEYLFRKPIRYNKVNTILSQMRKESLDWMKMQLGNEMEEI